MRIIISPAKTMRELPDSPYAATSPVFIEKTNILKNHIRSLTFEEQKKLWSCNDKIAQQNVERFTNMGNGAKITPAIMAYDGIQYSNISPETLDAGEMEYLQEHLRILSGFYGVLKPLDGIMSYRLEMQSKAAVDGYKNLYEFWGESLYREVVPQDGVIIDLASKEYSKCIKKHLRSNDRFISVTFGELINGKLVQKGVYAKIARGEMVRYLAKLRACYPEQLRSFCACGYKINKERSSNEQYVFIRTSAQHEGEYT